MLLLRQLSHDSAVIFQYVADLRVVARRMTHNASASERKSFARLCDWIFERLAEERLRSPHALPALLCLLR